LAPNKNSNASLSDPETVVIHFWSPVGVSRRPQRATSAAAAAADAPVYSQFAD